MVIGGENDNRIIEKLVLALVIVSLLLLMGKALGLPIALFLVSGTSMVPTLQPGDIVVGLWPGLHGGVHKGDIVIYCLPGPIIHTSCIVHRVIEIRQMAGKILIVTKGDALRHPDPPIYLKQVRYVVVARIPRQIVLAVAGLLSAYILYRIYLALPLQAQRGATLLEPGAAAVLMVAVFAAFNIVFLGIGTLDVTQFTVNIPRVYENIVFNETSRLLDVMIRYEAPLHPLPPPTCSWGNETLYPLSLQSGGTWVNYTLEIPENALLELWHKLSKMPVPGYPASVTGHLTIHCVLRFTYARLVSNYILGVTFKDLTAEPGPNPGSIIIRNPNPVSINVTLLIYMPNKGLSMKKRLTIPPSSIYHIDTGLPGALARLYYRFLGVPRGLSLKLR